MERLASFLFVRTAHLSTDLPVLIEVVEDAEHVAKLTPILDEMLSGGLVTIENLRVLRYGPGKQAPA